jgi:Helix-turn-helix of insertion element transposase
MPEPRRRKEREEAAQLIAAGELSDSDIAEKVGVTRKSIWDWRRDPEFMARVDKIVDQISVSLSRRAISHVERRVDALNTRWLGLQRIVDERAVAPEYASAPGGDTGLLVRRVKLVGSGKKTRVVEEFAVDLSLLAELRKLEKQAAQELGQWKNKGNSRRPLSSPEWFTLSDLGLELYEDPDDTASWLANIARSA